MIDQIIEMIEIIKTRFEKNESKVHTLTQELNANIDQANKNFEMLNTELIELQKRVKALESEKADHIILGGENERKDNPS